jgi:Tol biopolymer transport system component
MKINKNIFLHQLVIFLLFLFISCENNESETEGCPMFDIVPSSPYNDPIWHPSGEIIGFNHIPIKEIHYTYGFDCPHQATYIYDKDSAGFWLINADGTNQRRVLSYTLTTPAWSSNGDWIAFSQGAQIFKMPFDGNQFDTTAIEQLTFEGRNFFPTWSPDGEWIAYDSDVDSPTGLKFIWKMKSNGLSKKRIAFTPNDGETRMPFWGNDFKIVHIRYVGIGSSEIFEMDSSGNNIIRITENEDMDQYPKYSPHDKFICYISQSQSSDGTQLWRFDNKENEFKQLTTSGALNFSWSPGGKIVYLKFDYSRIDETKGTLWVMDADRNNKQQLTYNNFQIIQ